MDILLRAWTWLGWGELPTLRHSITCGLGVLVKHLCLYGETGVLAVIHNYNSVKAYDLIIRLGFCTIFFKESVKVYLLCN